MAATVAAISSDILFDIFRLAIVYPPDGFSFGGHLGHWYSNESVASLRLVCRHWREPALRALLHSTAIYDRAAAQNILDTFAADPSRKSKVRFLVLSLDEDAGYHLSLEADSHRLFLESVDFVRVISAVSTGLTHLHLHPLHFGARELLLPALRACPNLRCLIISPRFQGYEGATWGENLYSHTDVVQLALPPKLETLEVDFESSWSAPIPVIEAPVSPNALRKLRLTCDCDAEALWQVLMQSESLELCELYFERLLAREGTAAALMYSTETMRHLRFISNPTVRDLELFDDTATPLFDILLPRYRRLISLSVTATEISFRLFRLVPPTLRHLEIQSPNHKAAFVFDQQLIRDLSDPTLAIHLETFIVRDAASAYDPDDIQSFYEHCTARGIIFTFQPDSAATSTD
ncbi:hypothetical protein JCM10212_005408 [Sporobolomyces blumeae]